MDASKNNLAETEDRFRSPFTENSSTSRDTKLRSSSAGCSFWYDGCRDTTKKRKHSTEDQELLTGREGPTKSKVQDNLGERNTKQENQLQPTLYPTCAYGITDDASYLNNNNYPMMSLFPTYGPMNSQWALNPYDGMSMTSGINTNTSTMTPLDISTNSVAAINPFAFMGTAGDPNMYGMMGTANYGMFGNENMMVNQVKEVIHLPLSSLYPPNPNAPPPSIRPKPPGCKTIFVGGLPENVTEEIVKEIFQSVGEIDTIRMSIKNFCHIRFNNEEVIDSAIRYSGYRIKIGNKDDSPNTGRFHVDYAEARDDQYEYECRQRAMQREARHREREEQEFLNPPTPPPVTFYSDHEASILGEKLQNEESFQQATCVLITWLDRGECNKKNSAKFYSMIQSTNSHVRRLMNKKQKYEEELNKARMMLKQEMRGILLQFHEIDKVFNAASLQKVWDHFTKAQRKNIGIWKKQTAEIKDAHIEEVLNDRVEEEMELSDNEDKNAPAQTENISQASLQKEKKMVPIQEVQKLKEENDWLRCQLLASQNEMSVLASSSNLFSITGTEARLIGIISTFLIVHPFGISVDYICSYLHKIDGTINSRDVESLMKKFPTVFKEETTGIGASLEKKWTFCGFKPQN